MLARLSAEGVAVEEDAALADAARATLASIGASNVTVLSGNLTSAAKGKGPFDVIVLEGTVPEVPDGLLAQLKPEGRLVALIAAAGRVPVAHLFAKSGKGIASRADFDARLPPLVQPQDDRFVF